MERTWDRQALGGRDGRGGAQSGQQVITEHEAPVAAVLFLAECTDLRERRSNLARFFLESPLAGSGLDLRRDRQLL